MRLDVRDHNSGDECFQLIVTQLPFSNMGNFVCDCLNCMAFMLCSIQYYVMYWHVRRTQQDD